MYAARARSMLVRLRAPSAFFAAIAVIAAVSALEVVFHAKPNDLLSFYVAAKAASAGADLYDHSQLERIAELSQVDGQVFPYLYPPFLAHVLRWFAQLDLPLAHAIWLAASVLSFAAAVTIVLLAARRQNLTDAGAEPAAASWSMLAVLAAALVWALPLRNNLVYAQVNPFVLLFVSLAVRSHLRSQPTLAGIWLAPAILIKLTPGVVLLFFLVRSRYRTVLSALLAMALLALSTLPFGSAPDWLSFVRHLPERNFGETIPGLFSPASLWNFAPAGYLTRLLPDRLDWVPALSLLVPALLCGVALRSAVQARSHDSECLALASLFPVMVLASPLAYLHHLIYLLPAAAIWLLEAWRRERHALFALTLVTLFVAGADWPSLYERLLGSEPSPLVTSINLYAVLALAGIGWTLTREAAARMDAKPTRDLATRSDVSSGAFPGQLSEP